MDKNERAQYSPTDGLRKNVFVVRRKKNQSCASPAFEELESFEFNNL